MTVWHNNIRRGNNNNRITDRGYIRNQVNAIPNEIAPSVSTSRR